MNAASVIFDFDDPGDAVFPFACRHPSCEVVAIKRGVRVRAYESVLDFHPLTIMDDPGIKQALFGRLRHRLFHNADCLLAVFLDELVCPKQRPTISGKIFLAGCL
jgi:hypothetical protein